MSWWTFQNRPSVGPCWSPQRTGMSPDVRRADTWQLEVENKSLHVKEKGPPFSSPPCARSPERQTEHTDPLSATAQICLPPPRGIKSHQEKSSEAQCRAGCIHQTLAPPWLPRPRIPPSQAVWCQDCWEEGRLLSS